MLVGKGDSRGAATHVHGVIGIFAGAPFELIGWHTLQQTVNMNRMTVAAGRRSGLATIVEQQGGGSMQGLVRGNGAIEFQRGGRFDEVNMDLRIGRLVQTTFVKRFHHIGDQRGG